MEQITFSTYSIFIFACQCPETEQALYDRTAIVEIKTCIDSSCW